MSQRVYKHLFGPVSSRRLGRSLGVDLVPHKVCPIDCVYCEVGPTTIKTVARREYVSTAEILAELRDKLDEHVPIDIITLSGSGEPTLHSEIGTIIREIKKMTPIPVAVLTNGNLLYDPQVRQEILQADMVLPSLDAGDEETYRRINRPCAEATFERLIEGLKAFRHEYLGRIRLEVFFVAGINDTPEHARKIRVLIDQIKPDRIDVNSVARPPAEESAVAVDYEKLRQLAEILGTKAEVVASRKVQDISSRQVTADDILALLRRRGCTADELTRGLSADRQQIEQLLRDLLQRGLIRREARPGGNYYQIEP
jgi:wyosine [tRNA(Phe)-imidazoG37] synthetase (radical SAM superfamily)